MKAFISSALLMLISAIQASEIASPAAATASGNQAVTRNANTNQPEAKTVKIPAYCPYDHDEVIAYMSTDEDPFKTLLNMKQEDYDLNSGNAKGRTILMLAAQKGLEALVMALILLEVDTTLRTPVEYTYVGGWTCVSEVPGSQKTASQLAKMGGNDRLARLIDSAEKIRRSYEVYLQLMIGLNDPGSPFSELPKDIIKLIHQMVVQSLDN